VSSLPRTWDGERRAADDLDRLYRTEAPRLARYFRGRMRGGDDVADLVQESFVRFVASSSGVPRERPAAFLQRIARNLLIDRTRRVANRVTHVEVADHPDLIVAPAQLLGLEAEDIRRIYAHALAQLPPKTRTAFLLHRQRGMTYAEVAVELGISIPGVQYHIAKALTAVARVLADAQ
jgi:RNA polymerase sigma-70 factor (ECF subfamily)